MKKMKSLLTSFLLVVLTLSCAAQSAIVFIHGNVDLKLQPATANADAVECGRAPWLTDNVQNIWAKMPQMKEGVWNKFSFRFIPEKDGKISITLIATADKNMKSGKTENSWILWDTLSLDGATLMNGDMELKNANGKPAHWLDNGQTTNGNDLPQAHSGSGLLCTAAKKQAVQSGINVTAGQEVTLTGYVYMFKCIGQNEKN